MFADKERRTRAHPYIFIRFFFAFALPPAHIEEKEKKGGKKDKRKERKGEETRRREKHFFRLPAAATLE